MRKKTAVLSMIMAVLALVPGGMAEESQAGEVAGVSLAETVKVGAGGETLILNGAGVRKKFVVKVYVGALYLQRKMRDSLEVLDDGGPKRVMMHILHKEVGADKLADAWNEGFRKNQGESVMRGLTDRLETFNALFPTVRRGDRIEIDLLPRRGAVVRVNGRELGSVEGGDFSRALLEVWLGANPADKGLKKSLLGK